MDQRNGHVSPFHTLQTSIINDRRILYVHVDIGPNKEMVIKVDQYINYYYQ
jgi:hypothetical protein